MHDGDGTKENGKPYGDECKGHYVLNASSNQKPDVVHQSDIRTKLAPNDVYSGMRARVTINFYGFSQPQKIGVGCGLGNVMKTRDDEPLAGGASAESDFDGVGNFVQSQQTFPGYPAQGYAPFAPTLPAYQPGAGINPFTGLPA